MPTSEAPSERICKGLCDLCALCGLKSGRLGAFRHDEDHDELSLIGIIRPGEPVGEMSLIAGTQPSAIAALGGMLRFDMLIMACGLFIIAAADVPLQWWNHHKQMKMTLEEAKHQLIVAGFKSVDYLELREEDTLTTVTQFGVPARLLVAAHLGTTRLIDNVRVT